MTEIIVRNRISRAKLQEALNHLKSIGIDATLKDETSFKSSGKRLEMKVGMWSDMNENEANLRDKAWSRN